MIRRHVEDLTRRLRQRQSLLSAIEWTLGACPECRRAREEGHREDCELEAALREPIPQFPSSADGGEPPVPRVWDPPNYRITDPKSHDRGVDLPELRDKRPRRHRSGEE